MSSRLVVFCALLGLAGAALLAAEPPAAALGSIPPAPGSASSVPRSAVPVPGGAAADLSFRGDEREAGQEAEVRPATAEELLQIIAASDSSAVLMNVWATWCIPCREEFPDLLQVFRDYRDRGLRLVLVSGDHRSQLSEVVSFLEEHGVDFPTYIKEGKDMEFIDGLNPEWSGALPATFVYDGEGGLRSFWEGKASYETFEARVLEVLASHERSSSSHPEVRP